MLPCPKFLKKNLKQIFCANTLMIQSQGHRGGGWREGRSETNIRWYVPQLATASQNHTASCLTTVEVSRKTTYMACWHLVQSRTGRKRESFICWVSCFLSLLGRTSPNGTLKPAYPSRLCNPAAPGCRWGNQVLCPWSGASSETRHERAKAPVGETGHSWAMELLWLPPQQTLWRPCQSPALTRGVLRQMAVLGDEVTEEAAGGFC